MRLARPLHWRQARRPPIPEGLLMYSLVISDILTSFADVTHCFILGDVTYGVLRRRPLCRGSWCRFVDSLRPQLLEIKAFRYDPYLGKLFLEEYDHKGMRETRRRAIEKAKGAKSWGIVLGTLGRQGNPRVLERLEGKMREKGFDYFVILMSEISPTRIALFEDSVDAWVQIACPRLSIDWGDAFVNLY
ncbi:protein BROTHER of FT and TFL 1 [Hibiscus syriacus]|uniref:Protein BROTHER of FT and TFL 1 n=1 Tax=Hibiscus syriacus TaxID=106335 RepID=A0A6A2Y8V0_HIBSY|nr:protein BROTHER of FT and TFL 1 [Hibiscus syriacus]